MNSTDEEMQNAQTPYQVNDSQSEENQEKTGVRWGLIAVMILGGVLLGLLLAFYGDKIIWAILGLIFIISVIFGYFRS